MLKSLPSSVRTAGVIFLVFAAYFILSMIFRGEDTVSVETVEDPLFRVVATEISPAAYGAQIGMRGRTEATRKVTVSALTAGVVIAVPAIEGDYIQQGEVLCQLAPDTRNSALAEARASYAKAKLDYDAAVKLSDEGFQSSAAVAAARATLDLTEANLDRIRKDIEKLKIKAPFPGIFTSRTAEIGDLLGVGSPCGTVADINPIKITGALSEQQIGRINKGNTARVSLATGETFDATVSLVGSAAAAMTRTFRVELDAPNPDRILDGITADVTIFTGDEKAHLVPRNALLTDDSGVIGIRTVTGNTRGTDEGEVRFIPVKILNDDENGLWVSGVAGPAQVIVRGQNYVKQGQKVVVAQPGATASNSSSPALN